MNKGRRNELRKLKYQRRMRNFGYSPFTPIKEGNQNFTGFVNHGSPCSCSVCQQPEDSYNRAKQKSIYMKQLKDTDVGIVKNEEEI